MRRFVRRGVLATVSVAAMVLSAVGGLASPVGAATLPTIAGTWSEVPAFPDAVAAMTVTTGADGRIYLFGFCEGTCPQLRGQVAYGASVTYIYDPVGARWENGVGAPAICAGAKASAPGPNGTVYLGGCWKDMVHDRGVRIAIYDPATAKWAMESGHGPFFDPTAGMAGPHGEIYWFGDVLQRQGSAVFIVGRRVAIDNGGLWFRGIGVPSTAPSDAAALGRNGLVYAIGGWRNCQPQFGPCPVPPVQAYGSGTNSWTQVTRLPTPRIRVAATTDSQGRIFTIGGLAGDASRMFRTVEVYVPKTQTWWKTAPLPSARMVALATATPDGKVWVLAGYDSTGFPLNTGACFTPTTS